MGGLTPSSFGMGERGPAPVGMMCPVCRTAELKIAERQGVEIDYCPKCRGIWLDRGELDKIIDRSERDDEVPPEVLGRGGGMPAGQRMVLEQGGHAGSPPPGYVPPEQRDPKWKYDKWGRPYKRRSWLKELLDIID
ncbi:MAG: zf-TFIIB domain-containing protein [Phycisphaerales bacterium JB040]